MECDVLARDAGGFPARAGMVLYWCSSSTSRLGFPRPRGDGPQAGSAGRASFPVSPPARGWSRSCSTTARPTCGFPARAGMVRYRAGRRGGSAWFPRPRGDGPPESMPTSRTPRVSPPARGWSHGNGAIASYAPGFPARAGMVRCSAPRASLRRRFPRPRGDGPHTLRQHRSRWRVSPPARGWSRPSRSPKSRSRGFPARAGMVPLLERRGRDRAEGFPARAGMVLIRGFSQDLGTRFPRPRGDGPRNIGNPGQRVPVSPPARGWSSSPTWAWRPTTGFPARAGMVPTSSSSATRRKWFPRPRGDGPYPWFLAGFRDAVSPPARGWSPNHSRACAARSGFPARAGMVRLLLGFHRSDRRFPRPRGDGPQEKDAEHILHGVSPPARGWSLPARRSGDVQAGFPARAGMVPGPTAPSGSGRRFPRPRGDGPIDAAMARGATMVSPPARGWSARRESAGGCHRGFPARAGMVPAA